MKPPPAGRTAGITRRRLFRYSAATAASVISSSLPPRGVARAERGAGTTQGSQAQPARLSLPPPSGSHPVATTSLHLVDVTRTDPWVPGVRELMIQLWYPTLKTEGGAAAYMPEGAARHFAVSLSQLLFETVTADTVLALRTRARAGADIARPRGGLPVVLFSPGEGLDRSSATAIVTDLASHGFAVVGIDHTHDSAEVEFPDGRVEVGMVHGGDPAAITEALRVRAADTRFVVDQLAGINTDGPLRGAFDLSRIGMLGHSLGGATAAQAMLEDPRISAGVNMDGTILGSVAGAGLDQPFLLVGSLVHDPGQAVLPGKSDASWHQFWVNLRGWRQEIVLSDGGHLSFTDIGLFGGPGGPLDASAYFPSPTLFLGTFGSIDPPRAALIDRVYLRAFFGRFLRGQDGRLLDGPSPAFPEILFEQP